MNDALDESKILYYILPNDVAKREGRVQTDAAKCKSSTIINTRRQLHCQAGQNEFRKKAKIEYISGQRH